ncbi:MAG: zinc ribbon domain-containing protein, partial [Anaerolineales bacterium]|nr:zinc ribbon domain-containing protein [Anaerolineales bacterium]
MARKSVGFIRTEWTCPNCGSRNPGPEKTCGNCGAPQPDNVKFEQPAERKFVEDEKAIKRARIGPDIHCGYCGARNAADAETCSQCGGDLREGKLRQAGQEMAAPSEQVELICANCQAVNPATNRTCQECGAPLSRTPAPVAAQSQAVHGSVPTPGNKNKPNWWLLGGIAAAFLVCCIAVVGLFFIPAQSVQGTVSDVYWKTSVPVQEYQTVNHSSERGNPPSDAYNVSCETRSEEVCEEKTVDRGNGYAEVVQDCHTETEQYCSYTVDEWRTVQTYTLDGHDHSPVYDQPVLLSDQRLGSESVEYTVFFSTEKGQKSFSPDSPDEFQKFE